MKKEKIKKRKKKQELISRQEEQRNKIQPDIEMEENPKNKIPMNIDEFEKIEVLGGGNCAFRAILASANLKPEEWKSLRKITAKLIREFNWGENLTALNYASPEELAEKVETTNSFVGYEELTPFFKHYNIKCYIYLTDDKYKKNRWIKINDQNENNTTQESIYLSLYQGTHPELEGHYDALTHPTNQLTNFKKSLFEDIQKIKAEYQPKNSQIRILLWNCDSLGTYTKRGFLLQQLYENNIQICFLQESMLIQKDKLFLSGFKTYRADNTVRRKGVITLISDQLDCLTYKTIFDNENGRFLQVKLKSTKDDGTIILNNVYLEPDNNNKFTIPQEIWNSEHIIGDLNQLDTGFEKIGKIYHMKNMGKIINKIEIPKKISDHPMIILQMEIPIPMKEKYQTI